MKRLTLIVAFFLLMSYPVEASRCHPTEADVEGPYYLPDTPFREELVPAGEPGERIEIRGKVISDDCMLLEGVLIEVWHTDAGGNYRGKTEGERYRGRLKSSSDGSYRFSTIMPGRYRLGKSYRPAHIHFKVSKEGYETLITQLYFSGDPYLPPNDPCGAGCRSDDPQRIMELKIGKKGATGFFMIVLQSKQD